MDLPQLHLRARLRAAGYTDDELRRMLRSGHLVPVRRGCYLDSALPVEPAQHHALSVAAAVVQLAPEAVVSHVSAAVLHGLPIWAIPLQQVHVTRARRTGGRSGSRVHVHTAPLAADEVVPIGATRVTSLARTVCDVARTAPFEQAVVVADGALRTGRIDRADLAHALSRAAGRPGAPQARRVIAFADGRSDSAGESRSRVAIARAGLPTPVPQWEVRSSGGLLIGAVDFGWPEQMTIGEFDGEIKYGRLLKPGQSPGDVVFEEKRREDALRDEDLGVVRWLWSDLGPAFAATAQRLRHRFRAC